MKTRLELLEEFFIVWQRCESNRGCYSCCEAHDQRCFKLHRGGGRCNCGRDDLDRLEREINETQNAYGKKRLVVPDVLAMHDNKE